MSPTTKGDDLDFRVFLVLYLFSLDVNSLSIMHIVYADEGSLLASSSDKAPLFLVLVLYVLACRKLLVALLGTSKVKFKRETVIRIL